MKTLLLAALAALAQPADHSAHGAPPDPAPAADPHAGHDMPDEPDPPEADPHTGHAVHGEDAASGTDLPPGDAPAPAPLPGRAADRFWGAEAMARADRQVRREHGGFTGHLLSIDLAEYRIRDGRDGYRWSGEGWFGGDVDRLVVKSEGEGDRGGSLEQAEVQLLYSRALDPYWNLQIGARHDFRPDPSRSYAVIGVEGLAPYWFEVEGALFLSDKGDLLARLEAYYDQRITQRLILQPRIELNFAAQDVPRLGIGSGLSDIEAGLRLRYAIVPEFAPYVGLSWERKLGDTARFARATGEDRGGFEVVIGISTWF